jgi:hypothetical protein
MSGDGGMEQLPAGLAEAGATTSYYAWGFFFVTSILLNFVTLNLLLAMCARSLQHNSVSCHAAHLPRSKIGVRTSELALKSVRGVCFVCSLRNGCICRCVATLENVNDEFNKLAKDQLKVKKLQAQSVQKLRQQEQAILASIVVSCCRSHPIRRTLNRNLISGPWRLGDV